MIHEVEIPGGTMPETIVPSPDARRVAYVVRDDDGQHVEVDGEAEDRQDAVSGLTFRPDSSGVAYAALRGRAWSVVFGSTEWGPYDDVGKTSPVISPNSQHVAYTARRGREWYAFLDGDVTGGPYEGFVRGGITFSPDSARTAYAIKKGPEWIVVAGGTEQEGFAAIIERSLVFSPDSEKLAYGACVHTRGWFGRRQTLGCVVVNGTPGTTHRYDPAHGNAISDEIVFSPDSQRLAHGVVRRGKCCWVVDGTEGKAYGGFVSGRAPDPNWPRFPDYGKSTCRKHTLVFSSDSQHFAYAAAEKRGHVVVFDGEERSRHPAVVNAPIVFSPDSARTAYAAEEGGKQFLVVDWGPLQAHYGTAGDRSFSPDSSLFAYIAMEGPEDYRLVVGARQWEMPGGPLVGCPLVWDDDDNLHTLVAKKRWIVLVRYRVR